MHVGLMLPIGKAVNAYYSSNHKVYAQFYSIFRSYERIHNILTSMKYMVYQVTLPLPCR